MNNVRVNGDTRGEGVNNGKKVNNIRVNGDTRGEG